MGTFILIFVVTIRDNKSTTRTKLDTMPPRMTVNEKGVLVPVGGGRGVGGDDPVAPVDFFGYNMQPLHAIFVLVAVFLLFELSGGEKYLIDCIIRLCYFSQC